MFDASIEGSWTWSSSIALSNNYSHQSCLPSGRVVSSCSVVVTCAHVTCARDVRSWRTIVTYDHDVRSWRAVSCRVLPCIVLYYTVHQRGIYTWRIPWMQLPGCDIDVLAESRQSESWADQNPWRPFKKYALKQTKVFWLSKITENQQQKSQYWRDLIFDGKWKTNPFLERLNYELFDVLRTEFMETDGHILPFFDIYDMSFGVLDWALDGIHRKAEWYDAVLSNWMQTFCQTQN